MTKPKVHLIPIKRTSDLPKQSDIAPKELRPSGLVYIPRIKSKGEALSPSHDIWSKGVYDGKELRAFEGRPGSMDAYSLPSRGDQT